MRFVRHILLLGSLLGLGACYVETGHPHYHYDRYAYYRCPSGTYWDGYRCRYYHHYYRY